MDTYWLSGDDLIAGFDQQLTDPWKSTGRVGLSDKLATHLEATDNESTLTVIVAMGDVDTQAEMRKWPGFKAKHLMTIVLPSITRSDADPALRLPDSKAKKLAACAECSIALSPNNSAHCAHTLDLFPGFIATEAADVAAAGQIRDPDDVSRTIFGKAAAATVAAQTSSGALNSLGGILFANQGLDVKQDEDDHRKIDLQAGVYGLALLVLMLFVVRRTIVLANTRNRKVTLSRGEGLMIAGLFLLGGVAVVCGIGWAWPSDARYIKSVPAMGVWIYISLFSLLVTRPALNKNGNRALGAALAVLLVIAGVGAAAALLLQSASLKAIPWLPSVTLVLMSLATLVLPFLCDGKGASVNPDMKWATPIWWTASATVFSAFAALIALGVSDERFIYTESLLGLVTIVVAALFLFDGVVKFAARKA